MEVLELFIVLKVFWFLKMRYIIFCSFLLIILLRVLSFWGYVMDLCSFNISREVISPYECGFDGKDLSRLPFSLRFFLIIIIYILLDVEICLLLQLPYELSLETYSRQIWFFVFLLFLLIGLCGEFRLGLLNWKI